MTLLPKPNLLLGPTAAFVQERGVCWGRRNCADTSKGKHGIVTPLEFVRLNNCLGAKQCEVKMSEIESIKDNM